MYLLRVKRQTDGSTATSFCQMTWWNLIITLYRFCRIAETFPGVLCLDAECSVQERQGPVEACPEEGYRDEKRTKTTKQTSFPSAEGGIPTERPSQPCGRRPLEGRGAARASRPSGRSTRTHGRSIASTLLNNWSANCTITLLMGSHIYLRAPKTSRCSHDCSHFGSMTSVVVSWSATTVCLAHSTPPLLCGTGQLVAGALQGRSTLIQLSWMTFSHNFSATHKNIFHSG